MKTDTKRAQHIHFALNDLEKQMVAKLASHTGLSLSDVMRSALRAEYRNTFERAPTTKSET